jgi:dTMP kinase
VTIEGPDGVGKTSAIENLKTYYSNAIFIREPGTTLAGERIRDILLHIDQKLTMPTEILLFMASMCETSEKIIRPALEEGRLVVADRWFFSTIAYQGYANKVSKVENFVNDVVSFSNISCPDLSLILMAPWSTIQQRLETRNSKKDKIEDRDISFKKRTYEYYENHCPGVKIDASETIEKTGQKIVFQITQTLLGSN